MFVEHKEVGEVIEAPAKTLKLSEAIRIGISAFPVKGYEYYDGCALCCAGNAIGRVDGMLLEDKWPELRKTVGDPSGHLGSGPLLTLRNVVSFLNGYRADDKSSPHWTRERIADWLESQGY